MYNYTIANDISELKQNRIWKKNKKRSQIYQICFQF